MENKTKIHHENLQKHVILIGNGPQINFIYLSSIVHIKMFLSGLGVIKDNNDKIL